MDEPTGLIHDLKEFSDWTGEKGNQRWVQMYPYASWTHPIYSDTHIDRDAGANFVQHFNDGTIGKDLVTDYDHGKDRAKGGKASGQIVKVVAAEKGDTLDGNTLAEKEGVWGLVEFTDTAKQEIDNGEWRYFSTSHYDTWTDPQSDATYNYVLDGGALTNKPYVKGLLPLNFSEHFVDHEADYDLDDNTKEWLKEHAVISGASRNNLPDSAFLYIEPGGKKDAEGKTVPRSKRHLIFKNASGQVDMNHVNNAKARLSQSGTGTSGGESWLTDSLRKTLLARVNSLQGNKKENSDVELEQTLRDELKLNSEADLVDYIKNMNEEVTPLREFKAEHQSAKKFADEYPAEAARMLELEAEAKENRAKNFSDGYKDMRFTHMVAGSEGEDPKKEPTTLGLSALALESIGDMAKKFHDGNASFDDFKEFMDVIEGGVVDYGNKGSGRVEELETDPKADPESPQAARKMFSDLIDSELVKEGNEKLTYEQAYAKVAVANPELLEQYKKFKPVAA